MRTIRTLALAALAASLLAPASASAVPPEFFGIAPQTVPTEADVEHMKAGRIGSVRWPLTWESVERTPSGGYDWTGFDQVVRNAALGRLRVLPFIYATPSWLARKFQILPIDSGRQRRAWTAFVRAAVERYGRQGEFWSEHGPESADPLPQVPVREWQVWNEANFFYFAFPASPSRYARLLRLTSPVIRSADPGARILLSGLFGDPTAKPPNALPAVSFLQRLYRVPGIRAHFDGVALHPYADGAARLEELTEEIRRLILEHRDPGARLYITEMGWGSQNNPNIVSFERGVRGQVREMRLAYRYLIANRGRLNLKATYWFTWKDLPDVCNFCDSTGFFRQGDRLRPKPAWHAFVGLTGGRARP
jgi:hypothetical protein